MANAGKHDSSVSSNGTTTNGAMPATPLKGGAGAHQRTYQACIPCRKRKVKCDLGPVDNPHDPPCRRCKRESKNCVFDAERRKKRPGEPDSPGELDIADEPPSNPPPSAKRVRYESAPNGYNITPGTPNIPLAPRYSLDGAEQLKIGNTDSPFEEDEEDDDPQAATQSAAILQNANVYSQNDALELLYKAAHHRTNSMSSNHASQDATPGSNHANPSPHTGNPTMPGYPFMRANSMVSISMKEAASTTWKRTRFVRAGWFRAEEGIAYIDYFFKHLHGLTPITIPDYSEPSTHKDLLENEPILALTLLTIASRYMTLPGPGGQSRSMYIHQCLTDTLHKKINRIIWGQKQFGGGFCHAGARRSSKVKTLWEDLGTVESLMLLTEWHPRSLHFPPGDDDGELLNPLEEPEMSHFDSETGAGVRLGSTDRRVDSWLEPCWRSDRMCWMLLNVAMSLAIESGVFDSDFTPAEFKQNNPELTEEKIKLYFGRKHHLKDLLPVYCAATSGRLELTANLPRSYNYLLEVGRTTTAESRLVERLKQLGYDRQVIGNHANALKVIQTRPQDAVIHFWVEITMILDHGNQMIYSSRKYTRDLIEQGTYAGVLEQYKPMLADWHSSFTACTSIPPHMRYVLLIEYEYSRAFLFLLSLNAVVWRCTKNNPMNRINRLAQLAVGQRDGSDEPSGEDIIFSPDELRKSIGNDTPLLQEIISACRNIFEIVIHGLRPGDFLKHCPVRTYFRIISAALILLKTFVVGASETDISKSLSLMDTAVKSMRNCIVDDVHVGNRFAMMCESLGRRIRSRMVRIAASGASGAGASRAETPARGETVMAPPNGVGHYPLNGLGKFDNGANLMPWGQQTIAGSPNISGRGTPNPALWGVTDRTFDINSATNMTVLPPPTEYYNNPDLYSGLDGPDSGPPFPLGDGAGGDWNSVPQDWLTLSYESLLNGGEISAGPNGPNIGGEDMLDRLLWSQGGA